MAVLIRNLSQVVQITDDPKCAFLRRSHMRNIKVLSDSSAGLSILVGEDGRIVRVGSSSEMEGVSVSREVDARGGTALPGLVDGHSHPVFHGDRVHEFAMKLAGATYNEIQKCGGGIHFTTTKTREASEQELKKSFEEVATRMIQSGTTTLEAKSGYGLDIDTEIKGTFLFPMLRICDTAKTPLEISATFCGAHAVPKDSTEDKQTELICNEVIPLIKKEKELGRLSNVENIDVFCEKGNFLVPSTRKILIAGQAIGLHANFHAEELSYIGGVEMGNSIKARAMSHLEEISDEGIAGMAASEAVAVLLPSTAFILKIRPPPARKMIDQGVICCLGSDFNPNAHCLSMPTIMFLSCITMGLSMEEALVAATLNSAHSIGRGLSHGAIAPGRVGDIVIISLPKWEHLIYQLGGHADIITHVIKKGQVVYAK